MTTSKACVLHGQRDLRIETREVGNRGPGEVRLRVGAGGICGSDLHDLLDGRFGAVRVRQPIILGHQVAGVVEAVGSGVAELREGDRAAFDVPMNAAAAKELRLAGTFRFGPEFAVAAGLIGRREIDARPLITVTRPLAPARWRRPRPPSPWPRTSARRPRCN